MAGYLDAVVFIGMQEMVDMERSEMETRLLHSQESVRGLLRIQPIFIFKHARKGLQDYPAGSFEWWCTRRERLCRNVKSMLHSVK